MKLSDNFKCKDLRGNIFQMIGYVEGYNNLSKEKITVEEVLECIEELVKREDL